MNARSFAHVASIAPLLSFIAACADSDPVSPTPAVADGCAEAPPPEAPAASCEVTIASPPISGAAHVPEGTQLEYCSNPPSSGDHYPVWAAFQEYAAPVDWPYLVHSLEHGAVLLLYKCDPPGCPAIVDELRKVRDRAAADPLCAEGTKRIILAPSPTIPTAIAAAAWGKTYHAACVDVPTLEAFVRDNYAKGPENLCAPGRTF